MATIVSHAAVPLAIAVGLGGRRIPRTLALAGVAASMLPDADVIFFRFGATYDSSWAHRGFTHSVGFAIIMGLVAVLLFWRARRPVFVFVFVAFASVSHGLLDMLTNGGHGVAILWPASTQRYFFDWRPIEVSPLAAARFVHRAVRIAFSEFLWIWVPATIVGLVLRALRHAQGANL
ncbi:MAG TPA: metal-dependent hydrolase [Sphingomicrobium sp.]|nr:metal-dependent hydrolase [Sphingomicrobium sp.]